MNNLKQLIKEFREMRERAIQGYWSSDFCGDIYSTAIINDNPDDEGLHGTILSTSFGPDDGTAEFVAYSANNIAKLLDAMEILVEGLEEYANPQNWRYKDNGDVGAFDAWLDFKPGHYSKTHQDLGIHIAKKALQLAEEKVSGDQ